MNERIETLREVGHCRRYKILEWLEWLKDMPDFHRATINWARKPRKYCHFKGDTRVLKFKIHAANPFSNFPYESDLPF